MIGADTTFSRRTVTWLIVVGACAFIGMSYLLVFGEGLGRRSAGTDSYSHSAIGHAALVEFLRQNGISVQVSRYDSAGKAGPGTLLVAAEPESPEALRALLEPARAERVLLVLPKWRGMASSDGRWIESASPLPVQSVEAILQVVDPGGRLARGGSGQGFARNAVGVDPQLAAPQVISAADLRPVVVDRQGYVLVGEAVQANQVIWVLSDPDIIANHGIGLGDNAAFTLALVDALRPPGGTVVIDETIHGFTQQPSLWRALFEPPFVLATLQALVTVALLLWAGVGRFGPPLIAKRAIAPGAATLLDAGANLLKPERNGGYILRRYADAAVRDLAGRLHAPAAARPAERTDWLDRVGRARGVALSYRDLGREIDQATAGTGLASGPLVAVARRIHSWKRDMLHGP